MYDEQSRPQVIWRPRQSSKTAPRHGINTFHQYLIANLQYKRLAMPLVSLQDLIYSFFAKSRMFSVIF